MKLIQFNTFGPVTVVETPSFLRDAKKMMSDDEREVLINFLAYNPNAGVVIKGTGGVRKIRWNRDDSGKSGGFRIIYFFHSGDIPLFALNVFAKNEKENISQAERNELKKLTSILIKNYKNKEQPNEGKSYN
jgi:hypothetical protein